VRPGTVDGRAALGKPGRVCRIGVQADEIRKRVSTKKWTLFFNAECRMLNAE
jgi:hypothetical protein